MKHEEASLLLSDHLLRELDEAVSQALALHLEGCAECRRQLESMRELRRELQADEPLITNDHPDADELVAFLDPHGDLGTERMAEIALHIQDCGSCARELDSARSLLSAHHSRHRPYGWFAAAALIALLVFYGAWHLRGSRLGISTAVVVASLELPEEFDRDEADPVLGQLDPDALTAIEFKIPLNPIRSAAGGGEYFTMRVRELPDRHVLWSGHVDPGQTMVSGGDAFRAKLPAGVLGSGTYELEILDEGEPVYYVKFRLHNTHGGKLDENGGAVIQTPDGGFMLAAGTYSFSGEPGRSDGWVRRLNEYGELLWERTYGSDGWDFLNSIRATPDDAYVCTGYAGSAYADLWLLKFTDTGEVIFDRRWGTEHGWDNGRDLICTADGGYAVIGYTRSYGSGPRSVYLVKTDAHGRREWDQTYGGPGEDTGVSLLQTPDRGFLLGCHTGSFGAGKGDLWMIKTDARGEVEWERTYGDSLPQGGGTVLPADDGGYYLLGHTMRDERLDFFDGLLIKIARDGEFEWERRYGGEANESLKRGLVRADGMLVLAGCSSPGRGNDDVWLLGLDAGGDVLWENSFGGPEGDRAHWLSPTLDGGFMICATTESYGSGDEDIWLIKTDSRGHYEPGMGSEAEQRYWSRVLVHALPGGVR